MEENADVFKEENPLEEIKKDTDAILDAVKELTKVVGELKAEHEKWRVAGKF